MAYPTKPDNVRALAGARWFFEDAQHGLSIVTGRPGTLGDMNDDTPSVPPSGERPIIPPPAQPPAFPFGGTPTPPAVAPAKRHGGRAVFATSVVVASLLVGGAAGVGGAAAWDQWGSSGSSSASPTATRSTSPVVDTPAQPAADGSVEQVAQDVLPSVVKIEVSGPQESGSGSGIILSSDGQILTNNHVVEIAGDSGSISVSFNDGSSAKAKVLGTDPLTDTAVIQAEGVDGLTPA
ncbi:MAG: peptidase and chymotrypsin/Hap, partial [Nocardioides sp.]|nr:peptidase and chymotrypsin/Hap [Nocardioides sp.]